MTGEILRTRTRGVVGLCIFLALSAVCRGFHLHAPVVNKAAVSHLSSPSTKRFMSSPVREEELENHPNVGSSAPTSLPTNEADKDPPSSSTTTFLTKLVDKLRAETNRGAPPVQVDDFNLLFYDLFLIVNLSLSISFWVVHRMDLSYIGASFNEGCLMSLLWIGSGLYTGAFLNSAVDGNYGPTDKRGGPTGAGILGFHTFLNAVNLRVVFALVVAVLEHRPVGSALGEQLLPLEIGFGLVLMGFWRALHSSFVPRL